MWVHRLSNINSSARTADCAHCGHVRVTKIRNSFRCGTASYLGKIKTKYGIHLSSKPEKCEVCESSIRIVYDHSHETNKFRGWLCNACNVALGLVKDDPEVLRALARYLEER